MDDIVLKIKGLVTKRKLTYEQFAVKIGKSKQTIVNYFNLRSKIDIYTLQNMAEVLEVPVSYFFESEKKIIGDNNTVNIDSPISNSNNRNINNNNTNYSEKAELLEAMGKIVKNLELNNKFYTELASSLLSDISNLYVDLIEKYPETKEMLKKHETTKTIFARLNTYKLLSGEEYKLDEKFLEYIKQ